MQKNLVVVALVFVISLVAGNFPREVQALDLPRGTVQVAFAEDKTRETDCRISINGGLEVPCRPGSVVFVYKTTLEQVKRAKITNYVRLTGSPRMDNAAAYQLAYKISRAAYGESSSATIQSCSLADKWISLNYLLYPNDLNSSRVYFELYYTRTDSCWIENIHDRDRLTQGTSSDSSHNPSSSVWNRSCSDGTVGSCTSRYITLNSGSSFTSWQYGIPNSFTGRTYANVQSPPCMFCGSPYVSYTFN